MAYQYPPRGSGTQVWAAPVVVGLPEEVDTVAIARKMVVLLAVAFAVFYLVSQPEDAADAVRDVFTFVGEVFDAIIRFFRRLAG